MIDRSPATSKDFLGKRPTKYIHSRNIHRETIPDKNFENSPKIQFCEFIENSKRSQLQMSPGTHVPNFEALGAPKSKWQASTDRQTPTTTTHAP